MNDDELKTFDVISLKGFLSFTREPQFLKDQKKNTVLILHMQKDNYCIFAEKISVFPNEKEVILAPGNYKVIKMIDGKEFHMQNSVLQKIIHIEEGFRNLFFCFFYSTQMFGFVSVW